MDEANYHRISKEMINKISDMLEEADNTGTLELELTEGIITLTLPAGKQLLITKHTPSRELWLSSPLSGGLHFPYRNGAWQLADGRTLGGVLTEELKILAGIEVRF